MEQIDNLLEQAKLKDTLNQAEEIPAIAAAAEKLNVPARFLALGLALFALV